MKQLMIMVLTLVLITGGAASVWAAPKAESKVLDVTLSRPAVKLISGVVYAQVPMRGYDSVPLAMDLMVPQGKENMPAVIFITGGGFINANKDSYIQQRLDLAEQGYVTASVQYRVAPTSTFPAPLEDIKSAVRYLRAHAAQYHVDPAHIGLLGGSAGGYLAAIAGTTNGTRQFDTGENLDQSSDVQAVVDWYGVSDLASIGADYDGAVQQLHQSAGATEALWINGSPVFGGIDGGIAANPEGVRAANPLTYISSQTPPFLLMHGDADVIVSPSQSDILHQALTAQGVESTRYVVHGAAHGGSYWVQPEIMKIVAAFFDKHLKQEK